MGDSVLERVSRTYHCKGCCEDRTGANIYMRVVGVAIMHTLVVPFASRTCSRVRLQHMHTAPFACAHVYLQVPAPLFPSRPPTKKGWGPV